MNSLTVSPSLKIAPPISPCPTHHHQHKSPSSSPMAFLGRSSVQAAPPSCLESGAKDMGETTSGQDRGRFPLFNLFPNIFHPAPQYPVSWPEVASAATAPHPPPTPFFFTPLAQSPPSSEPPTLEKILLPPLQRLRLNPIFRPGQGGGIPQPQSLPILLAHLLRPIAPFLTADVNLSLSASFLCSARPSHILLVKAPLLEGVGGRPLYPL